MKLLLRLFCCLWWLTVLIPSCRKERSCENCPPGSPQAGATVNQPPLARAGADQVVKLPADSTLLDGRASSDPDGKVVAWLWRQIAGPASAVVARADAAATMVRALVPGSYRFELTVTDDKRLSAKDSVAVEVQVETGINRSSSSRGDGGG